MIPLLELMQISNPDQLLNLEAGAFNNLPFHFYWKDNKGKYLGCNDTQALFVGLEKGSDLFGCTDYDLCWSKYAPLSNSMILRSWLKIIQNHSSNLASI